jgi:PAS domain S-box-containing protein
MQPVGKKLSSLIAHTNAGTATLVRNTSFISRSCKMKIKNGGSSQSTDTNFLPEDKTRNKSQNSDELKRNFSNHEALLAAIPDILMEVDNHRIYIWANSVGFEFFGEDVIGKEASFYFEGDQNTYDVVAPLFTGSRETFYVESWQRRKDGEKRLLGWHCHSLKDENGNTIGALSSAQDITDRRQLEIKLKKNQVLLDETQHLSKIGGWEYDPATKKVFWTSEVYRIHGVSKDFDPSNVENNIHFYAPEDQKLISEAFRQALENGVSYDLELQFVNMQGERLWVRTIGQAEHRDGKIVRLFGNIMDITGRKQSEQALRASDEKFKYVFDHSSVGKSFTLVTGEINVNAAFCDMLGYTQEELKNKKWPDISHPDDLEPTQKALQSLLSGEAETQRFTKRYFHKNGSVVWGDLSTSLRRDENDQPLYFMTTVIDITNRKLAEEELQKVSFELQLIFKNMINALVVWESVFDDKGNYVSFRFGKFNDAYSRIADLKLENVQGKDVFEIWPTTEQSWLDMYRKVAVTGKPESFDMYHGPTKGWYHCNAYRPTDSPDNICVIFEDITESKAAAIKINENLQELKRWQGVMLGREDRILELKREVNQLRSEAGKPAEYPSVEAE